MVVASPTLRPNSTATPRRCASGSPASTPRGSPGCATGRARRITEAERGRVIQLVATDPPGRLVPHGDRLDAVDEALPACWTLDTLTEAAVRAGIAIARSQLRRILRAEQVRWRRPRAWASSTDPDFAPKGPRS